MDAASPPFTRNALALVSLVGSTLAALSLVPASAWRQPQEPSVRAAALMVVVLLAILVLRSLGAQGALRERQLLCVFLAAMPLVYMESGLWNDAGSWLLVEGTGLIVFSGWAWLAYRRDAVWLATGIAAHGLLWDSWHNASSYIPAWYGHACLVVDLGLALYVLLQRGRLAVASGSASVPVVAAAQELMPVLDAQAAAIRADMLQDLTKTLRTLERLYGSLQQGVDSDASDRRARYVAACQDIRIVLTRLLLLLPSLKAGGMVMPDVAAQRQQTRAISEQSAHELSELGVAAAVARHTELFQQTIEALQKATRATLGESGDKMPTVPSLDALSEHVDRAQRATQLLQLSLAQV